MKSVIVAILMMSICSTLSQAEIISWDASSGLYPFDGSIEENSRFMLNGDFSWLSFQDGAMNVNDDSSKYQLGIGNVNTLPLSQNWAYQIDLRMNFHSRPVFDYGAVTGITVQDKLSFIVIASDRIGFNGNNEFLNNETYLMNTTDSFHTYRAVKNSGIVSLYVDTFDIPVISIPYADFLTYEDHGTSVKLVETSNPGLANFDIKSFAYNPDGTTIPEPASLSLLCIGGLALLCRRRAV